jgi:hypothetical protein
VRARGGGRSAAEEQGQCVGGDVSNASHDHGDADDQHRGSADDCRRLGEGHVGECYVATQDGGGVGAGKDQGAVGSVHGRFPLVTVWMGTCIQPYPQKLVKCFGHILCRTSSQSVKNTQKTHFFTM